MENPFSISEEKLRILLDAFLKWYESDEKEREYAPTLRKKTEEIKKTLLNRDYLSTVSNEDLIQKIFSYSRELEGPVFIQLGMPRITGEVNNIKRNLLYLLESTDDPFIKAARILEGDYKIPIFAKAFWSPLFQALDEEKLPNWNNKSENFFKKVGIDLKTPKLSAEEKYRLLSKGFAYLKEINPVLDFYYINHLMHYGTAVPKGIELLDELTNSSKTNVRYFQIAPGGKARLWEDLYNNSIAAVGWKELDFDLTGIPKKEFIERHNEAYPNATEMENKIQSTMLWNFLNLKPGDKFVTNKGRSLLLAVAIVKGAYRFEPNRREYKHTVPVDYYKVSRDGIPIPEALKGKFGKTITPLSQEVFESLESLFPEKPESPPPRAVVEKNPILPPILPEYPISQLAEDVGYKVMVLSRWINALERKGQAIIYGPPGTGKTFVAERLSWHLVNGGDGFSELVQFHPAYAYEDFIQGIRPQSQAGGNLSYPVVPGRFLEFCNKASKRNGKCVLIIDEINRANLAKVFGELMYLLEYRSRSIPLAGGGEFKIPQNVRIIGTMNTADRSIALVDHALRRRFSFIALYPNYEILQRFHMATNFNVNPLVNVLNKLNKQIGDRHYEIGISFFLRKDLSDQIEDIWRMEIEPYLEEYFFDQPDKIEAFRWDKIGGEILA